MQILVTISDMNRAGIVLDLDTMRTKYIPVRPEFIDCSVIGRAPCRPFGITWSRNELFIANNRQLLVFDKQLNFIRTSETRLQVNVHQLGYRKGRVWVVSPWTNSLIGVCQNSEVGPIEFDLLSGGFHRYVEREATEEDDRWHYNSLLWAAGHLYVAAHAFGGLSFINRYDATTMKLDGVQQNVGASIHGLARHGKELFWLSTKTGEIRSDLGYCLQLSRQGYARGFAASSRHFIVAISEFLSRGKRHAGDSWIHLIDRVHGTVIVEVKLPDTGSVNDLRLLDEFDYAHHVEPFWSNTNGLSG
jgi:hypothetical protein